MGKRTIQYSGRAIVGNDIPFHVEADANLKLRLDDGALLNLRPVVVNVVKTEEQTSEGEPLYVIQSLVQIIVAELPKKEVPA